MSTRRYTLPVDQTQWEVPSGSTTIFNWEYDESRDRLLTLYEKGKEKQWNAQTRLDWSIDVDPTSDGNTPDYYIPIYGSEMWERLNGEERGELRHHISSWMNSQFLHGEQGALICASKIVQTVPDIDSKFYAATQVMDEARHVEMYAKYVDDKLDLAYPINQHLKALLNDVIGDERWDMTYLGMQVVIEGLALAAFSLIRDFAEEPLAKAINTYVMQDEARHVAFGLAHLERTTAADPALRGRLRAAVERRHDVLADTAGLNEEVFDSLVVLAAGSWEPSAIAKGYERVQQLEADMDEGRQRRLIRLGFPPADAAELSALHTRNFM